jgi:hypothetical protein
MLLDIASMQKVWTKTLQKQFDSFLGFMLDNANNIYMAYLYDTRELAEDERMKSRRSNVEIEYALQVGIIRSESKTEDVVTLKLNAKEDNIKYRPCDIEFSTNNANELLVGGFLKEIHERKGRDLVNCGIFNFRISLVDNSVRSQAVKIFDPKLLVALESNNKKSRHFDYKLDYIIPSGKDVYFIGEQYKEECIITTHQNGAFYTYSYKYVYEYMDVIIAKLNEKGEFEWITNVPFRNEMTLKNEGHVFKQYFATLTKNNIYIFRNDHPKNLDLYNKGSYDPKVLKSADKIHGSSFICSTVALSDGTVKNKLVFENEDYCFAPLQERNPEFYPPSDTEIFVPCMNNEVILYTENKGKDRFIRLKLAE